MAGLGTVGGAVARLLVEHASLIEERAGRPVRLTRVASRTPKPEIGLGRASFDTDLATLQAEDVDVVVELIGGDSAARDVVETAIGSGRPVVTANKALLAARGDDLFALSQPARGAGGLRSIRGRGHPDHQRPAYGAWPQTVSTPSRVWSTARPTTS